MRHLRNSTRSALAIAATAAVLAGLVSADVVTHHGRAVPAEPPASSTPLPPSSAPGAPARTAAGAAEPGGSMPTGNPPGWTLVADDDFIGTAVDPRRWEEYAGVPRFDPSGLFSPSHLRVAGGVLTESTYRDPAHGGRWTSAGIKSHLSQTYGRYEVRMRFGPGAGVAHNLLLFPSDNRTPPEIDFSEDDGSPSRLLAHAILRYGAGQTERATVRVNLTRWHTWGVEWTPGRLRYTLDGRVWATMVGTAVPHVPLRLAVQTQAEPCLAAAHDTCGGPTPRTVDLQVAWVVQYAPRPQRRTVSPPSS